MWGALLAAVIGIFSSMFNITDNGMIHNDAKSAPVNTAQVETVRESWFDDGMQENEQSGGAPTNPLIYNIKSESADAQSVSIKSDTDETTEIVNVTAATVSQGNESGEVMTVLSGN